MSKERKPETSENETVKPENKDYPSKKVLFIARIIVLSTCASISTLISLKTVPYVVPHIECFVINHLTTYYEKRHPKLLLRQTDFIALMVTLDIHIRVLDLLNEYPQLEKMPEIIYLQNILKILEPLLREREELLKNAKENSEKIKDLDERIEGFKKMASVIIKSIEESMGIDHQPDDSCFYEKDLII